MKNHFGCPVQATANVMAEVEGFDCLCICRTNNGHLSFVACWRRIWLWAKGVDEGPQDDEASAREKEIAKRQGMRAYVRIRKVKDGCKQVHDYSEEASFIV